MVRHFETAKTTHQDKRRGDRRANHLLEYYGISLRNRSAFTVHLSISAHKERHSSTMANSFNAHDIDHSIGSNRNKIRNNQNYQFLSRPSQLSAMALIPSKTQLVSFYASHETSRGESRLYESLGLFSSNGDRVPHLWVGLMQMICPSRNRDARPSKGYVT